MLRTTATVTAANFPRNKTKYPMEYIVVAMSKFDDTNLNASLVA